MRHLMLPMFLSIAVMTGAAVAQAEERAEITLKNHQFVPPTLIIPAGKQVKLTVRNLDPTPAEFESHDLRVEKVVPGNGKVVVFIGPLRAGSYGFFDDFHEDTTKGRLVVK